MATAPDGGTELGIFGGEPVLPGGNRFQLHVAIVPEEEGGFSIHALRLPGVVSQGETVDEAIANLQEAFLAALETYREANEPIPWAAEDLPLEHADGSWQRWLVELVKG